MRELKLLVIVVFVIGVIYWGVEPLAHSVMHPKVSKASYDFKENNKQDIEKLQKDVENLTADLEKAKAENNANSVKLLQEKLDSTNNNLAQLQSLGWVSFNGEKADIQAGLESTQINCLVCHTINSQNLARTSGQTDKEAQDSYFVLPPDLSNSAAVFDLDFLVNFLRDPKFASKLWDKDGFNHPMPAYSWMDEAEVNNIVAYLASIAPEELDNKAVFDQACQRCHDVSYDKVASHTSKENLDAYVGSKIPDLSMMIRSRGADYLHKFINDPQKLLPGTAMPRVGLTEQAEKQVVSYLESVGDSKKAEREALGFKIIIFFVVLSILAYLWKRKIWSDIH